MKKLDFSKITASNIDRQRERIKAELEELRKSDPSLELEPSPDELQGTIKYFKIRSRHGEIQVTQRIMIEELKLTDYFIEDRNFDCPEDVHAIITLYGVEADDDLEEQCKERGLQLISCKNNILIMR